MSSIHGTPSRNRAWEHAATVTTKVLQVGEMPPRPADRVAGFFFFRRCGVFQILGCLEKSGAGTLKPISMKVYLKHKRSPEVKTQGNPNPKSPRIS